MGGAVEHVLVIADIEGGSGCFAYGDTTFLGPGWPRACAGMTLDVAAVVAALFDAGVERVTVKDFHRTGFNLLPERIDGRARVHQGYRRGPIPGLGDAGGAQAVMFLGMHAASGTPGFLAHTLTSRIASLTVNGAPVAEVQLFAAVLARFGVRPLFFSGCPVACGQASGAFGGIALWPLDKSAGAAAFSPRPWRRGLAAAAAASLDDFPLRTPYRLQGPLDAVVTLREGERCAARLAARWRLPREGPHIRFRSRGADDLFDTLVRLCYLTPRARQYIALLLPLYHLGGRLGLWWVRRRCTRRGLFGD